MRRETLGEKAWAGDRKPCAPRAAQRVAGIRESMLISHRRRGYRAHTLFLKKEEHLSWSPLTRGDRGGISPYLAAERPGPGGLGPSGAGSPSGRRWKQLERERREAERELGAASPAPRACGTPLLLSAWSREHPLLGEALQLGPAQEHLSGRASDPQCLAPWSQMGTQREEVMRPRPLSWTEGLWPLCSSSLAHTCCRFPCSKAALPPPSASPSTHCPRAGAHALPETGSMGGSGLPLLTCGSSIHTEKHRGAIGP